jgi:polyphosphate:AMP phosphotransferase
MFETAELGRTVSAEEFDAAEPALRTNLVLLQHDLASAGFPVVVLFAGVDGAGKSESINLLHAWMDPRGLDTHAYTEETQDERERPEHWRYWRDMPGRGRIGLFRSAWYSPLLLGRVHRQLTKDDLARQLDRVLTLEQMLVDDGALVLKFWMHLNQEQQLARLEALRDDPLTGWRVSKADLRNAELYPRFIAAAERIIARTSTGGAPWTIVEGADPNYRSLTVTTTLRDALSRHLERHRNANEPEPAPAPAVAEAPSITVLDALDMTLDLKKKEYRSRLEEGQARLGRLFLKARKKKLSIVAAFEGWDAAGKGGAIRRATRSLDARHYAVIPIAAPTDEERAHHYLWRFWRRLPRDGRLTVFDRSWYGRVLVERVEGFARHDEWRRAFAEINAFEAELVRHGTVLLKFWINITPEEQLARFEERENTPWKQWKITDEDWRNREKWPQYELAVHEMIERTSTVDAPWTLVEGNSKRWARVKVLETMIQGIDRAVS